MTDFYQRSLIVHEQLKGKMAIVPKIPIHSMEDLSIAYTPGVAKPCEAIAENPEHAWKYTIKKNTVAVVSDGSAVLGLGNIGPEAAIPVMEGKAILFKQFADIDAWPLCLNTQDTEEIIQTVRNIAPVFGGVNLEDISAPRCFEIEDRLQNLGIPVFHDDQHGTAIVLLAALLNASKVLNKSMTGLRVVINGAGAAGIAIAKLLSCKEAHASSCIAVKDIVICDSKGAISPDRQDLSPLKKELLTFTNKEAISGSLSNVVQDADVFIGVSKGNVLTEEDVRSMAKSPVILAMANPIPEIMPDLAKKAGAKIVGTGRSDFPNQVNNVLAFPGIFRGALDARAKSITNDMKLAAAFALADTVKEPTVDCILPNPLDTTVSPIVAKAVQEAAP